MTDLDFLLHCEHLPIYRQTGRTTALAEACLKIDGVFLVAHEQQRRSLKRKYPQLDVRIASAIYLVGNIKPMIFDHYAIMMLLEEEREARRNALFEIDDLKAKNRALAEKIERVKEAVK